MFNNNKISKTVSLNSQTEMREICDYLRNFGIDHFSYIKCFADGTHISLNTHNFWLKHVYQNYATKYSVFFKTIDAYASSVSLWQSIEVQDSFTEFKQHSGVDHGIVLIQKSPQCCEFYNFATSTHDHRIINFYLNNLNILWKHTFYFKDKAATLIKKANDDRWILPKCTPVSPGSSVITNLQYVDELCMDKIKKFYINEKVYLTRAEAKCCYYLAKGKRLKEIASLLRISPKTVEAHLAQAKRKFGCYNLMSLIQEVVNNTSLGKI